MLTPSGSSFLPFHFLLLSLLAHTQVNQASSRDHALQGKCVQVQCNLQVLSSCILRTQTDVTVSEISEISWSFYFCALLSALSSVRSTVKKYWGRMCPQLLIEQSHLWKKSNGSSLQHYSKCITSCQASSGWDIPSLCFCRKSGAGFFGGFLVVWFFFFCLVVFFFKPTQKKYADSQIKTAATWASFVRLS